MVLGISPLLSGLRLGEPNTSTAQAESQTKGSLFYMDANDMKLSDYLTGVGRPISYFPKLRRITGSTNATIFLCQLVYWTGKGSNPDGWIYKTSDEFEDETGLSYDEQKTARKKLIEAGLMEERYARLEHQMYFRVLVNAMNDKWGTPQDDIPEHGNTALGKADSPCSLNSNTENTAETTTEITTQERKLDLLDGILAYSKPEDRTALDAFERAMGFNPLPWDSERQLGRLKRFLQGKSVQEIQTFAAWSKSRYSTAKPAKIRQFPKLAMDLWPLAFEAMNKDDSFYEKLRRA